MFFSRSKLKYLDKKINSVKAELDEESGALNAVNQVVQNAVQNSTRQINAFGNFLTIHKGRLVSDLNRIRELLTRLQDKECAKAVNKKEVRLTVVTYLSYLPLVIFTVTQSNVRKSL